MKIPLFLGKADGEYETEKTERIPEFSGIKLPVGMKTVSFYETRQVEYVLSENEAIELAEKKLTEKIKTVNAKKSTLTDKKIKKGKDGVRIAANLLCEEDIGVSEKIDFNTS